MQYRVMIEVDVEANTDQEAAQAALLQVACAPHGDTVYMHLIDPANGHEVSGLLHVHELGANWAQWKQL